MSERIRLDWSRMLTVPDPAAMTHLQAAVGAAHEMLESGSGPGSDFLGWLRLPHRFDEQEFARLKSVAGRIQQDSDALLVIGIGGSYAGARATIEALCHPFHNQLSKGQPEIYFAGKDLSPAYLVQLLELLEGKALSVNVISKSGTTTEPAIAFRIVREEMERRYGKEGARRRIYATTDARRGVLRQMAQEEGYESFTIPSDVGGRFSVLTPVGLLPMAVSGVDVDALMAGAAEGVTAYGTPDLATNPAYQYAAARHLLYEQGKKVELLVSYEPALAATGEWWKQLFGESEGKVGRGIFPASAQFSTDLHSLGQYIQEGERILFETVLQVERPKADLFIGLDPADRDGLNFLGDKSLDYINQKALEGTLLAHTAGGVPNLVVTLPELTAYHYGMLLYFFQKACAVSAYLLGVNPFDQPGVEAYKENMFALLGKPGYEARKAALERRPK